MPAGYLEGTTLSAVLRRAEKAHLCVAAALRREKQIVSLHTGKKNNLLLASMGLRSVCQQELKLNLALQRAFWSWWRVEREGNTDIQFEGEKLEVHPGFFSMCNHVTVSRWVIWDLLRHLGSRKDYRGAVGFSCTAEKFGEGLGCHPGSRKGHLSPGVTAASASLPSPRSSSCTTW